MDLKLVIVFFCMLVVLLPFLLHAKARIMLAETREEPLSDTQKRKYYLMAVGFWAVLATIVMVFAATR